MGPVIAVVLGAVLSAQGARSEGLQVGLQVPSPRACTAALPEKLTIETPEDPVSRGLQAEWAEVVKEARAAGAKVGPPQACTHEQQVREVSTPFFKLHHGQAVLRCGGRDIPSVGVGDSPETATQMLVFLLSRLSERAFCTPEAYAATVARGQKQQQLAETARDPARCPAKLELTGGDDASRTALEAGWSEKLGRHGKAAPRACRFERTLKQVKGRTVAAGSVTCEGLSVKAEASDKEAAAADAQLKDALVERLAGALCGLGDHAPDPLACAQMPSSLQLTGPLTKPLSAAYARTAGKGTARLRAAGIEVDEGLGEAEAREEPSTVAGWFSGPRCSCAKAGATETALNRSAARA
ncbi:MAG: hypothetical protein ACK4N5_11660, partial [Myxococcales bacterium]